MCLFTQQNNQEKVLRRWAWVNVPGPLTELMQHGGRGRMEVYIVKSETFQGPVVGMTSVGIELRSFGPDTAALTTQLRTPTVVHGCLGLSRPNRSNRFTNRSTNRLYRMTVTWLQDKIQGGCTVLRWDVKGV